ncbi:hypothetical protein KS670_003744 [Vibrio parahaemolyticus]|nr:hypothetical protein [Vibrio parahaemolyticus]EJE4171594.1 hypothetical protein [Vibrio parahaemolyticus]EJG0998238.1 hypothetical protein [Vibrio parahaemolyticus]MDF4277718.1 hypothetical protein [Vibrio parahaemolyticus]MDF5051289.1 hypothetical protein [Vibrio parahaemolyticus]
MPDNYVVSKTPQEYGERFHGDLMEQYKIVRSMITDTLNERSANNKLMLSICTALIGLVGLIFKPELVDGKTSSSLSIVICGLISSVGFATSRLWVRWSLSYSVALKLRYKILKGMEVHLPSQPFMREGELRKNENYVPIADVVTKLSQLFTVTFVLLVGISIIKLYMIYS